MGIFPSRYNGSFSLYFLKFLSYLKKFELMVMKISVTPFRIMVLGVLYQQILLQLVSHWYLCLSEENLISSQFFWPATVLPISPTFKYQKKNMAAKYQWNQYSRKLDIQGTIYSVGHVSFSITLHPSLLCLLTIFHKCSSPKLLN